MHSTLRLALASTLVTFGFACKSEGNKAANIAPPAPAKKPVQQATSQPAQAGSQPAKAAPGNQKPFTGLLKLSEGVDANTVGEKQVIFVMARRADNNQLVAVQRMTGGTFPKAYEIGPKQIMMPGVPFVGPFKVSARVDRDGDPMTKGADDLYANATAPVNAGQGEVHLVLSKLPAGQKPKSMAGPASKPSSQPKK